MAEIRWFGHNCIRIRAKEATVLVDPVGKNTGYAMTKQTADIVLLTHDHPGHANTNAVKPEYTLIEGPGEYEKHAVFVFGIRTYHDKAKGAERGYNTMYLFELDGIRFAHLGDLGHDLNDEQIEALEGVDVVFAPVGGGPLLSPSEIAEVVGELSPKLVIPMQYKTGKGDKDREEVDAFCKQIGKEKPEAVDKLVLKPSDLPAELSIALLLPDA